MFLAHRVWARRISPQKHEAAELLDLLDDYLQTRSRRFPSTRRRASSGDTLGECSPTTPLFVGADGGRITRGTLQYRTLRAFKYGGLPVDVAVLSNPLYCNMFHAPAVRR
jgi:hypothetical protein